ncbi:hypothetical protein [Limnothrix sp. PR1529]|nr:hypothetical protein [Limnothrix sp. PR1529]
MSSRRGKLKDGPLFLLSFLLSFLLLFLLSFFLLARDGYGN